MQSFNNTFKISLAVSFVSPLDYLIFIFQIAFATSAVLISGTVVIGILATKSLRIQNRFIFMLNTSICDTLTGFSVYYLGLFDVQEGYPSRNGTFYILPTLLGVKVITFLFAQFDRYFAVCHPFHYGRLPTKTIVISINVYAWFHCYGSVVITNVLPVYKAKLISAFGVISLQIAVVMKVAMTIKLYFVAKFQLEKDPPSAERESKKESLKIIIFVVISFLVLWLPSFVNIVLRLVIGKGLDFENESKNLFANMARFNAVCTPAIYMWGSPALRDAAKRAVWGRACPGACKKIDSLMRHWTKIGDYSRQVKFQDSFDQTRIGK